MAHFGTDELLFPQRTRLPLVRQMCACALSKAPLSNDCADNDAGFPDPSSRRWRFVATQQEASAAGIAPNQRLQYLCLKQVRRVSTQLLPSYGIPADIASMHLVVVGCPNARAVVKK